MEQMEYRFEDLTLTDETPYNDQIVAHLNEYAKNGWRVAGIYLADAPHWSKRVVPVLLERRRTADVEPGQGSEPLLGIPEGSPLRS